MVWGNWNAHKCGFLKELSIHLTYDPEIKILNIYSRKMKMHAYTKVCAHIFIAAFLIIAKKTGRKINNHQMGNEINILWYTPAINTTP